MCIQLDNKHNKCCTNYSNGNERTIQCFSGEINPIIRIQHYAVLLSASNANANSIANPPCRSACECVIVLYKFEKLAKPI